jgi:hypothetical protein
MKNQDPGSPYDRGAADQYYHRPFSPHKWLTHLGGRSTKLTAKELEEYHKGWESMAGSKEWE